MVAYPRQKGGTVLDKKGLKATAGFSDTSLDERISVGMFNPLTLSSLSVYPC